MYVYAQAFDILSAFNNLAIYITVFRVFLAFLLVWLRKESQMPVVYVAVCMLEPFSVTTT